MLYHLQNIRILGALASIMTMLKTTKIWEKYHKLVKLIRVWDPEKDRKMIITFGSFCQWCICEPETVTDRLGSLFHNLMNRGNYNRNIEPGKGQPTWSYFLYPKCLYTRNKDGPGLNHSYHSI